MYFLNEEPIMRKSRSKVRIKQTALEKRLYGVHVILSGGKVDRTIRPTCLDLSGLSDEDKGLNVDYHRPATRKRRLDAGSHPTDEEMIFGDLITVTDENADTTIRPHVPPKKPLYDHDRPPTKRPRKSKGRK
jgi:hypothetical protein